MPTSKKAAKAKSSKSAIRTPLPPYGIAIKEAIARGNTAEMRRLAASARKYLTGVQTALAALEKKIS